ncbi:MAG: hypothetical protein K5867_10095 [Bacteroidales bacterium]|nr:hypothetical protein [Bacteroidales bacterium]
MERVSKSVIRNKTLITIFAFVFSSCYNPLDDISEISGMNVGGGVSLEMTERDESAGLDADFTSVYLYSINDSNIIIHARQIFQPYDYTDTGSNYKIHPFLNNTSGYYKTLLSDEDVKELYIDTVNQKMVYRFTHL